MTLLTSMLRGSHTAPALNDAPQAPAPIAETGNAPAGYENVFTEDFTAASDTRAAYDFSISDTEQAGLWATSVKNEDRILNNSESAFLGPDIIEPGDTLIPDPFHITDDGTLEISSTLLTDAEQVAVRQRLADLDATSQVPLRDGSQVRYTSGALSTQESWGQTYGYFEIRAKMPEGVGNWAAFWLAPALQGWPPEIDVFEILGRENGENYNADNIVHTSVHFDNYAPGGLIYDLAIDTVNNAYDDDPTKLLLRLDEVTGTYVDTDGQVVLDDAGEVLTNAAPLPDTIGGREVILETLVSRYNWLTGDERYAFTRAFEAAELGIDVFDEYVTFGLEWTPDSIIWTMGTDPAEMTEIYRTETPTDLRNPGYFVLTNEIGGGWAWRPETYGDPEGALSTTFDIDYVRIMAPTAATTVTAGADPAIYGSDADEEIFGDDRGNLIEAGGGFDRVTGGGGADLFYLRGGEGNLLIRDFDPDAGDRLVLEGFNIAPGDGLARATFQHGEDVWIVNGSHPHGPQTVILKDISIYDLTLESVESFAPRNMLPRFGTDIVSNGDGSAITGTQAPDVITGWVTEADRPAGGVQTLTGAGGDDTYRVFLSDTEIVEEAGGGVDLVVTRRDYILPDEVENLAARDFANVALTGNDMSNRLTAGNAGSTLTGAGGDDLLVLGDGADTIVYGVGGGRDRIVGFDTGDTLELRGFGFPSLAALEDWTVQRGNDLVFSLGWDQSGDAQEIVIADMSWATLDKSALIFDIGRFDAGEAPVGSRGNLIYNDVILAETGGTYQGYATPDRFIAEITPTNTGPTDLVRDYDFAGGDRIRLEGETASDGGPGAIKVVTSGTYHDVFFDYAGFKNDPVLSVLAGAGTDKLRFEIGDQAYVVTPNGGTAVVDLSDQSLTETSGPDDFVVRTGSAGRDRLIGTSFDDVLVGGAGNDVIFGRAGSDVIIGGKGADVLDGGSRYDEGPNYFVYAAEDLGWTDRIRDFSRSDGDQIDLQSIWGADEAGDVWAHNIRGTLHLWAEYEGTNYRVAFVTGMWGVDTATFIEDHVMI